MGFDSHTLHKSRPGFGLLSVAILAVALIPAVVPLFFLASGIFPRQGGNGLIEAFGLAKNTIPLSVGLSACGGGLLAFAGAFLAVNLDNRLNPPSFRARGLIAEAGIMFMLAVPPCLWALALMDYWNRPGAFFEWVVDSGCLLLIGYLGRFLPITYRICKDGLEGIPTQVIEAAWLDGAHGFRLIVSILIPMLKRVLAVSCAIAFVLVFGELTVTLFLAPPGTATLPVTLYTIMANSPTSVVSGAALLVVMVCVPFAAGSILFSVNSRS